MVKVWQVNETFTHGFLVFPLTLWLIWQKRSQLSLLAPAPEPRLFALLALLLSGWFVGSMVDVQVVQQLFMISIIISTIWLVVGRQVLSLVLFPLLFLYFAVPFGQGLISPLMEFTADVTVYLIQLSGIPVYRDGLFFTLPGGSWSVVEECSGVRYLLASFMLGTIYAYINYSSLKKRLIFILLSIIVPIIGNALRAYGIVMIGHFSGMKLAVGADHLLYGWVFFGVIIFLLFFAGSFWRDDEESFVVETSTDNQGEQGNHSRLPLLFLTISFALIAAFYFYANHLNENKQNEIKPVSFTLPDNFSNWQFDDNKLLEWQPVIFNPDVNIARGYSSDNGFVQLNIGFYQVQRQGAEAISSMNSIASPLGGEWKKVSASKTYNDGLQVIETILSSPDTRILVWHWYRIGQHETTSPYLAKAMDAYNLIVYGRMDASMITLSTRIEQDIEPGRQRIIDFWSTASSDVNRQLEQTANE